MPNRSLKTKTWKRLASAGRRPFFQYDSDADYVMFSMVPFDIETTVHYIDKYFAFLYTADKEIVGFQIENFAKGFLPQHASIEKVWKLSEVNDKNDPISNFGELTIKAGKIVPLFFKEILKTADYPRAKELEQAFQF